MAKRIESTQENPAAVDWAPTSEVYVQADFTGTARPVQVEISARADALANWEPVGRIKYGDQPPIARFPKYPFIQVKVTGNTGGATAIIWSGE